MAHLYLLSLDTGDENINYIKRVLIEKKLATHLNSSSLSTKSGEEGVFATVPNKRKFERFVKRRNYEAGDPRSAIKGWEYKGVQGKSASSSKERRLVSARLKRIKASKREKERR